MKGRNVVLRALAGVALVATPFAIVAQEPGGLDIPANVKILGPMEPGVRKATAVVNGTIITETDVDQRLALVLFANQGKINDDERVRLRQQVLSNLIDETLQIQEAAANKIVVEKKEVDSSFARVATQFKQTPVQFAAYVRKVGSSEYSLKRQIEGESAWRRLLGRQVEPFVSVSDEEVNQIIARMKASKGQPEYHVGEIYVSATPVTQDQVYANITRISDQIRNGASFVAYARQYSEASTAPVGGDLGWVRPEMLPDPIAAVLPQMQPGAVTNPIPVGGGYSVIALLDKRQVLTTDPRDTVLAIKELAITFPPNTSKDQAQPKITAFADALKALKGCGTVDDLAKQIGAKTSENDQIKVRDLPPTLQPIMLGLRVGEATPPFGSDVDGVRAWVVCGRDEPQEASLPSFDEIQQQLSDQRVNLRAQRYLRDLRRDAVIDYR